ncbi:MAG: cupin-like domain-containing protein [Bacteroidetes bacterium]|nr:cupin-like domain-containing protein [Bacteroidota bacterium]
MKPYNVKTSHWYAYNALCVAEHFLGHKLYQRVLGGAETSLFEKIDAHAATAPLGEPFRVLEFQKGEYDYPEPHPYYPAIYRGAADDWACTQKWSFDFFKEKFGDKEMVLTNNVGLVGQEQAKFETIKLSDFIDQMQAGSKKYIKFSQMIHENSGLQDDFNGEWLQRFHMTSEFKKLFFMFMGGKGTATPIHTALPPTVFVQVYGSKKWNFWPTSDRLFLGVRPDRRTYYHSDADPYNISDPKFPLQKYASRREVTINAGDVLWFPALVWHQVENPTDSIGVAYKFFHLPSSFRSSKLLTSLFFFATKPFIFKSALMSKINKREYIFNNEQ